MFEPPQLVLGFPEYPDQADNLAGALGSECAMVDIHRFPDGESRIHLPENLPVHVVFCRSLNDPNSKLAELMLAASGARELNVRRLTLVAPYLCYMRQDAAFVPGSVVSQGIIGRWLGHLFDRVVTVDPHLHRTRRFEDVVPNSEAVAVTAAPLLAAYLKSTVKDLLLVGPDEEAGQWVREIASHLNVPYTVGAKQRLDDREVKVVLEDSDYAGKSVVIVDDIVSTGETMAAAVRFAMARGAKEVICLVIHPLFGEGALALLQSAGASRIVSTDSIRHETNAISLAPVYRDGVVKRFPV